MLLVTHEMRFAREISDRVCFFDKGRIVEQGEPERIFTDPREPRTREFLQSVLSWPPRPRPAGPATRARFTWTSVDSLRDRPSIGPAPGQRPWRGAGICRQAISRR